MHRRLSPLALAALLLASGCDSVAPDESAGDNELVTHVTLALTPVGGGALTTATYDDANHDGQLDAAEFTPLALKAGTSYTGVVTFESPAGDVTSEILAESAVHQVLYTPGGGAAGRLVVTGTDTDANGLPVGLQVRAAVTGGSATTGTLRVVLSHYDREVKQAGVPSSEADFDGVFSVTITP